MIYITKADVAHIPSKIEFFIGGEYQFDVDSEIEINNIRIAAAKGGWWNEVEFRFNDHRIFMTESYALTSYPKGFMDTEQRQIAELIRLNREQK